jgi:glycosyltransferase involved in cell wall biosynthesis
MRVGIAIPSFLGARFIGRTLASLIAQQHKDWYCVVVNDGAEDGTHEVVRTIADGRIRYVCDGRRRGQFGNFNRAILEVMRDDAEVVRLLCSDDLLYPHDLSDVLRIFATHRGVGLVATHYDGIDADDRLLFRVDMRGRDDVVMAGRQYLLKGVAVGNTIGGPSSVALRREAIEEVGLFDVRVNHSGEADLWHRIAARWDIAWVGRRPGLQYRIHGASITGRGRHTVAKFTDQIQLVRRVASTEALLGPRWWVHQYTIGRLHALNLQVMFALVRRREWEGVRAALIAAAREGMLLYAPLWIPRIPYQLWQIARGRSPSRRVLWRRVHESLQPPRLPASEAATTAPSANASVGRATVTP